MVARFVHRANGVDRCHAAGKDRSGDATFQGCEILFQASARGIGNAGVLIALILTELLLDVGGSRVDGRADGAAFSIRLLPDVDRACGKTGLLAAHNSARNRFDRRRTLRGFSINFRIQKLLNPAFENLF